MTTYTTVADSNGDFTVPFSSNYTSGQKITVVAEKSGATKSIELFAPSSVTGGGTITWTGTAVNFPGNIGEVTIGGGVNAGIADFAFYVGANPTFGGQATGLTITAATSIGSYALRGWSSSKFLNLPSTLTSIAVSAFYGWSAALSLVIPNSVITIDNDAFLGWGNATSLTIGSSVTTIGSYAFSNWGKVLEMRVLATTPPNISSTTFQGLNSTCVIKVPSASIAAYKAAPNWSVYAARIQAI